MVSRFIESFHDILTEQAKIKSRETMKPALSL